MSNKGWYPWAALEILGVLPFGQDDTSKQEQKQKQRQERKTRTTARAKDKSKGKNERQTQNLGSESSIGYGGQFLAKQFWLAVYLGDSLLENGLGFADTVLGTQSVGEVEIAEWIGAVQGAGAAEKKFRMGKLAGCQQGDSGCEVCLPCVGIEPEGCIVNGEGAACVACLEELIG
jgi:hypothetical protein